MDGNDNALKTGWFQHQADLAEREAQSWPELIKNSMNSINSFGASDSSVSCGMSVGQQDSYTIKSLEKA